MRRTKSAPALTTDLADDVEKGVEAALELQVEKLNRLESQQARLDQENQTLWDNISQLDGILNNAANLMTT